MNYNGNISLDQYGFPPRTVFEMNIVSLNNIDVEIKEIVNNMLVSSRASRCSIYLTSSRLIIINIPNPKEKNSIMPVYFPLCRMIKFKAESPLFSGYRMNLTADLKTEGKMQLYNITLISKSVDFSILENLIDPLINENKKFLISNFDKQILNYIAIGQLQKIYQAKDIKKQYNFAYVQSDFINNDNFVNFGKEHFPNLEALINELIILSKNPNQKFIEEQKFENQNPSLNQIPQIEETLKQPNNQLQVDSIQNKKEEEKKGSSIISYPSLIDDKSDYQSNNPEISGYDVIDKKDLNSIYHENKKMDQNNINKNIIPQNVNPQNKVYEGIIPNSNLQVHSEDKNADNFNLKNIKEQVSIIEKPSDFQIQGIYDQNNANNIQPPSQNSPENQNQNTNPSDRKTYSEQIYYKETKDNQDQFGNLLSDSKLRNNDNNIPPFDLFNKKDLKESKMEIIPEIKENYEEKNNFDQNKIPSSMNNPINEVILPPVTLSKNETLNIENNDQNNNAYHNKKEDISSPKIEQPFPNPEQKDVNPQDMFKVFGVKVTESVMIQNPQKIQQPENKSNPNENIQIAQNELPSILDPLQNKNVPSQNYEQIKNPSNLHSGFGGSISSKIVQQPFKAIPGKIQKPEVKKENYYQDRQPPESKFHSIPEAPPHIENVEEKLLQQSFIDKSQTSIKGINCLNEMNNISEKITLNCGHQAHKNCIERKLFEVDKMTGNLRDIYCDICSYKIDYRILVKINPDLAENIDVSTAILNNYLKSTIDFYNQQN